MFKNLPMNLDILLSFHILIEVLIYFIHNNCVVCVYACVRYAFVCVVCACADALHM